MFEIRVLSKPYYKIFEVSDRKISSLLIHFDFKYFYSLFIRFLKTIFFLINKNKYANIFYYYNNLFILRKETLKENYLAKRINMAETVTYRVLSDYIGDFYLSSTGF